MPSEEVERELKALWKKWQDEERQTQTSTVETPEKPTLRQLLKTVLNEERQMKEDKVSPRYVYSDAPHGSKDFLVQINVDLLDQARKEAEKRKMSLSSYIRECLMYRLYKIPREKEAEIDQLLEECTSLEDAENRLIVEAFLNQIGERGLTGSIWTPSQIDKVIDRLIDRSSTTEKQCIEAMKLDKTQTQYFKTQIEYIRNTQPKQEEMWFVPFGICGECHRPLTKEQYNNLSECPYCHKASGIRFVYDEKSPAQPKPYAMCGDCHRPLPKECETNRECKYCEGGPVIVLNYEGIRRQTPSSTQTIDKEQAEEILEKVAESEQAERQASEESEET
jgi:uncharacterized CHY-type Zn-finger protein/predicted HicB family RNase H-like nuclease